MCFSPYLDIRRMAAGGGGPKGLVQFITLGSSKIEVLETYF